jgi:uncharacterized protein
MDVVRVGLLLLAACGNGGGNTKNDAPTDGFDRSALLDHLAHKVILPMQSAFAAKAATLPTAVGAYCNALDANAVETTRDAAQAAFGEAIDSWERAESLLVGPAAMDNKAQRDLIYSWPLISACNLDRDTVTQFNTPGSYDISTKMINVRSLTAIEYLLFTTDPMHSCIAEPAGWTALAPDLPKARCRLALVIATDVAAQAAALETAWRPDGGDYAGVLAKAGQSGSSITSAHDGINRVSDGIFYVDTMVKDMKLGQAAGIAANICGTVGEPCIREVESNLSDRGTFAIRANLAGLREGFTGTTATDDGPGFDDFLIAVGHAEVATKMTTDLDAAIAAATAMPDSYLTALTSNYQQVVATHTAVREFTGDLKSQFLTLLALQIPDDVATDND